MLMKCFIAVMLLLSSQTFAQDVQVLLREAQNLDRTLKEDFAFDKYKQVLTIDPKNMQALIRSAEISVAGGSRQGNKKIKKGFFETAKDYADKALAVDSSSVDANYIRALAALKLTEVETENKKLVAHIKDSRTFADKALSINPNHAKANYVLGKWNFDMVNMQWAKKAAVKVLFGKMPEATIEDAEKYMEKAKAIEPYFVINSLDLAKAYKYDNKAAKAIEVLNQLVRLPNRTADDANLKAEGKKMLSEMQ
jgi:tetratricopeptide (TPR) repeat protein